MESLSTYLPEPIKRSVAPLYFRYQSLLANREHEPPAESVTPRSDAPSHVLVVVIDALRPDFIPDVPLEFTHAIVPAPWTFPSVTSLHTGLRPSDHGAVAHTSRDDDEFAMPAQTDEYPHFPHMLEAAGYDTYAGCAFPTPFQALKGWYQTHRCYDDESAERVIGDYQSWRDDRERTAAYLHLGDLHAPVEPPAEYFEQYDVDLSLPDLRHIRRYRTDFDHDDPECQHYREQKLRLHRAALKYVSEQLRDLLSAVRDDTLVIVTGDHGEALWEHQDKDASITDSRPNHCFGHGGTPFDVIARVPLAYHHPSRGQSNPDGGCASVRDIAATVLDTIVESSECPGHSWSMPIPEDRAVICEGTRYGVERKAVYRGEYKLIRSVADDVTLTAEINGDEERFVNLPSSVVTELREILPDEWDRAQDGGNVSEFTKDQLKALGYK